MNNIANWNIEELFGYKPKTTFYTDFSIADHFGKAAIEDTYKRCMENWKSDYIYLTELVMVLNWKIWEHYQHSPRHREIYDKLWRKAAAYAEKHLKGDELSYYYRTTD